MVLPCSRMSPQPRKRSIFPKRFVFSSKIDWWIMLYPLQERLLSCERLESDKDRDIGHGYLTWSLVKRVLGSWRWYGCSLLVSHQYHFRISFQTDSSTMASSQSPVKQRASDRTT